MEKTYLTRVDYHHCTAKPAFYEWCEKTAVESRKMENYFNKMVLSYEYEIGGGGGGRKENKIQPIQLLRRMSSVQTPPRDE